MEETTTKTKKRRVFSRSGQNLGWEEREKARQERETRIDKFLNLAQDTLEKLTTPPLPPSISNAAYVAPVFDTEWQERQKINQHNNEMRTLLKNYCVIQFATLPTTGMPDSWEVVAETIADQVKAIDEKYPIT